jgi:fused signal recognition particle receptor
MVSFNWFSRSFNKPSAAASTAADKSDADASPEVQQEAQAASSDQAEQPISPEDYLAWAKAAYQNIQKQQATSTSPDTLVEAIEAGAAIASDTTTRESGDDAVLKASSGQAPPPEKSLSNSIEGLEKAAEAIAPPVADTSTDAMAIDTGEPSPAPEEGDTTAAPTASLPAWMQAADRQARLERLQETAIAEPEPIATNHVQEPSAEQTVAAPLLPDITFDEAFLWSAEILAAQGRQAADISIEEITWLNRLRQGLDKTRRDLVNQLKAIVGQGPLNEDAVSEIEALLLQADVGVDATDTIIAALQARLREEVLPPDQAISYLKQILRDMLDQPLGDTHNLAFVPEKGTFNIWMLTGVNGAGKTTTIGKLAHIAQKSGYACLIGAADTFRAAAVEQVKAWGARSGVEVIANPGQNTDPAAVVFDAIAAAQSRGTELLLVDTAGRLQNKKNLMDELAKIRRIIDKQAPDAHVESLLVLDATLGQNGLRQAEVFAEVANLSGVVLTKLDGTAKGGIALAVVQQLGLPIRFIGAGEGVEDLRPFSSYEFIEALLSG